MGVISNVHSYSLEVFIVFLKLGQLSHGSNCNRWGGGGGGGGQQASNSSKIILVDKHKLGDFHRYWLVNNY